MSGNDESLAQVFQKAEILFLDIQKSTLASNSDEYQVTKQHAPSLYSASLSPSPLCSISH